MSTIQNIEKLQNYISDEQLIKLEKAAERHKVQSNIAFKFTP